MLFCDVLFYDVLWLVACCDVLYCGFMMLYIMASGDLAVQFVTLFFEMLLFLKFCLVAYFLKYSTSYFFVMCLYLILLCKVFVLHVIMWSVVLYVILWSVCSSYHFVKACFSYCSVIYFLRMYVVICISS